MAVLSSSRQPSRCIFSTVPSISWRISSSRASVVFASKRSTRTGCVLDARTSPQPSGKVTRTPSTSTMRWPALRSVSVARLTISNFFSSAVSTRSSGVA